LANFLALVRGIDNFGLEDQVILAGVLDVNRLRRHG
jgi:hypothetical protein